jgi:hypothetical protein
MAKNKKEENAGGSFLDDAIPPLEEMASTYFEDEKEEDDDNGNPEMGEGKEPEKPQKPKPQPPENLGNTRPLRRQKDPENRPQTKVIDYEGYTTRKKRAVDLNLSERVLPPLTKGRTAVYAWIDKRGVDPLTGEKPEPKDPWLPGTYMFFDPYEADPIRRNKLQRNLGRPQMGRDKDGKELIEDTIDPIEFTAGLLRVVPAQNYRKYVFMELHPLNASNPFRPRHVTPLFERVDIKSNKGDAYRTAEAELAFDAEKAVVDIEDRDKIIGYAVSTGDILTAGRLTDQIKTDLRIWARQYPRKFFAMHNNVEVPVRLNLIDAIGLGLIEYQHDKRRYVDPESDKVIFVTTIGKDPLEDFVAAMVKPENREIYNYIMELLNYWEPV